MLLKKIYMYVFGMVDIIVEGFFIEKFINICKSEKIILWNMKIERGTILRAKICKSDFKDIKNIAKNTTCKVKIERKIGLPFILNKYRKRKTFAIATCVIAIFCFTITRFIWNIEIIGNEKISKEEIISDLENYDIRVGKYKSNLNLDKIKNEIRLNHDDLAWIGLEIKGTNMIVTVVESVSKPQILDKNEGGNIIADKDGVISKIIVRSGTAKVNVGDEVKKGDVLVEGIMEGKYTGARQVNCDADIYSVNKYEKEKKESFIQEIEERTGVIDKNVEIYINNFKIFFNKGVPKFKNCDTIRAYKKVRLFSNYYIPIEIVNITNYEVEKKFKTFTEKELTENITKELQDELNNELNISETSNIETKVVSEETDDGVIVKVIYTLEEKIGTKEL